jgi:hypothetical protein
MRVRPMHGKLAVLTMLVAMMSGAGVLSQPGVASAQSSCDPDIVWARGIWAPFGNKVVVLSATKSFVPAFGKFFDNFQDVPQPVTYTATESRTTTVTISVATTVDRAIMEQKLTTKLQTTVSTQIVQQRTTSFGVEIPATVPPRTRLLGEFGMEEYAVTYQVDLYFQGYRDGRLECVRLSSTQGATQAPTINEGWQFRTLPLPA